MSGNPYESGQTGGNHAPLTSEFADDPDMLELVEMFVCELPERIAALEQACEQQDLQTLATLSHQLKGAAGGYGFPTITDAAMEVEQQARTQAVDQLKKSVDSLIDLCKRATANS